MEVDVDQLKKDLIKINGVKECHDIHVWCLSAGKISMSCHLVAERPDEALQQASKICRNKYKIKHSTIQVESNSNSTKHECDHDLH